MRLKKLLVGVLITASALLLSVLPNTNNEGFGLRTEEVYAADTEYTSGLWMYIRHNDGTVWISGYSGFEENLTIPSSLDGYVVTGISGYAFYNNKSLKSVTIPNTVDYIGVAAFAGSSLTSVTIPSTVTVWEDCGWQDNITLPSGEIIYTDDSNAAFAECVNLKNVVFNTEEVPSYIFYGCTSITSVTLGSQTKYVKNNAFDGAVNLTSIQVNANLLNIGDYAFYNCKKLGNINLGNKLESIGVAAFAGAGLTSVTIPSTVRKWEDCGWQYNITLPSGEIIYTDDSNAAFAGCVNLKNVVFNAEEVPSYIFYGCRSITNTTLGSQTKYVKNNAFDGAVNLSDIQVNTNLLNIGDYAFYNCKKLGNINLGNKLESIGVAAFAGAGLTSVTIPSTVRKWGDCGWQYNITLPSGEIIYTDDSNAAFAECPNLSTVRVGYSELPKEIVSYSKKVNIQCMKLTPAYYYAIENGMSYTLYNPIASTSIKMQHSAYTLLEGDTLQLYPILSPQNTTDRITWTSGNEEIATINDKNIVEVKRTGLVAFKATTTSGKTCSFTVNVVSSGTTTYDTEPVKDITLAKLDGLKNMQYTGSAITPNVSVLFNPCTELIPNVDYTISFTNNKNIGTATVKVVGKGKYTGTVTGTFNIVLPPVVSLAQKKPYTSNTIEMTWKTIGDATGYEVYRATTSAGKYNKVATTTSATYRESKLGVGSTYYYKIRAYKTVNGKKIYGDFSKVTGMATKPKKVLSLKQKKVYSANSIQLTWSSVSKVTGYEIYRATSKNGKYKKVSTTTKTNIKNNNLKAGNTYYYKVRPYISVSGNKIYGDFSSVKSMVTKCKAPSVNVKSGKRQAKISWKKVTAANGYEIYMSKNYTSGYKKIKTLSAKKTSYTKKRLSRYEDYYIKVRAYRTVGGKKIYSSWSNIWWVNVY